MPHSCAFGCKNAGVVVHVFPNPDKFPERFKVWVNLVGGTLQSPSDYELYRKKRICDIHFADEHRNRFKRLNALAVPTLHLSRTLGAHPSATSLTSQLTGSELTNAIAATGPLGAHHSEIPLGCQSSASYAASVVVGSTSQQQPEATIAKQSMAFLPDLIKTTDAQQSEEVPTDYITTAVSSVLAEHNYSVMSGSNRNMPYKEMLINEINEINELYSVSRPQGHFYTSESTSASQETTDKKKRRKKLISGHGKTAHYNFYHTQQLRTKIRYLQTEINRLRKKGLSYKQRLENAEKMSSNAAFQRVVQHMTKPAQLLVHMQKQSPKKPKGRRYSIQEKILALSLYKKSPKCYRLLCEYFSLPSSKAMKRLLSQIKLTPGINKIIFDKIKKTNGGKDVTDRLCSLIFDEMSITPQVNYMVHKDQLEGFTSEQNSGTKFADHVLVFMVKGVKSNFKQPVAYYFTNALNKSELKTIIKSVIKHTLKSGLIVLNTVCDQSPVNVSAIKELVSESKPSQEKGEVMRIMGHDIIPLYDTPHLIKGFRNNLLTKDLCYTTNNEEKIIKWAYYQMVYNADKAYGELRLLDKLTEEHVTPEKINKMRVKSATQVFSHSVAVVTEHLTARGDLPNDCKKIVEITLLLDNLFDSLNVSSLSIPNGKKFKGPVKKKSPHHGLWQKAKEVLKTIKFIKKIKEGDKIRFAEAVVPSVPNMIKTIDGVERLWKVLSNKYNLDAMLTRNLNQDPLENFFGNIRSYGARNIAPNTVAFEGAFKALLLNNFSSPHSRRANCEKDTNECLQTLDFFLTEKTAVVSEETEINFTSENCLDSPHEDDAGQSNYVCGWVLKKCLQKVVRRCEYCRKMLLDNNVKNKNNAFIQAKEYSNKKWLCYPTKQLEIYFKEVQHIAVSFLKRNVPKKNLKGTMILFIETLIDFPFKCETHERDLKKHFLNTMLNVIIYSWCRSVNRILSGKLVYSGDDEIKIAAQIYHDKRKHYKNRK